MVSIWLLVHQGWEVWSKAREENGKNRQMGLCESFEQSAWNVGWLHELEQSFLVKKSRFSDGASFVLHNASASEICKYCYNTHYVYFSCHLHLRLHHLKHKLPFAISSLLCISQTLDQDRIVVRAGVAVLATIGLRSTDVASLSNHHPVCLRLVRAAAAAARLAVGQQQQQ